MTPTAYNTVNGIKSYLPDGLNGFHRVVADRSKSPEAKERKLEVFILLGRWILTEDGSIGDLKITHRFKDIDRWFLDAIGPVVPAKALRELVAVEYSYSHSYPIPTAEDKCSECGRGWTFDNLHDHVGRGETRKDFRHKRCNMLIGSREAVAYFHEMLTAAGFKDPIIEAIQNEYCHCDSCMPWVTVRLPTGDLKIGWRKRVINIDWKDIYDRALEPIKSIREYEDRKEAEDKLKERLSGEKLVTDDVTKWVEGTHAWGKEKAVEYLSKLRQVL